MADPVLSRRDFLFGSKKSLNKNEGFNDQLATGQGRGGEGGKGEVEHGHVETIFLCLTGGHRQGAPQTVWPYSGVLTVTVRAVRHLICKFPHKIALVKCPCAFRLRTLAQNGVPGVVPDRFSCRSVFLLNIIIFLLLLPNNILIFLSSSSSS